MRRSDALAPLSRDHHHALVVAQRLQRADAATAPAARDAFLDFWRADGRRHFEVEEEVLLPAFAPRDAAGEDAVRRVLAEHEDVRARVAALERAGGADLEALQALGALLRDHVRHEERVLFPLIEDALPEPELTRLTAAVQAAEAARG
jgi:iron-sulfur cluster repair protein YtfE (RIC family)